jgi:putative transposase
MAQQDLQVKTRRKFKVTTDSHHGQAVAPHVLECHFDVKVPDMAYVGDITYIWTAEGWLYLAVVIDLFSRAVVGWSMSPWLKADLVTNALQMALDRRQPQPGLLMHTDYVEVFYNRQRRHSSNGNLAPMVYERSRKAA